VKLGRAAGDFETFQALEMLSVGVLGKMVLWTILLQMQHQDEILEALNNPRFV
jgi:hypothetical protein